MKYLKLLLAFLSISVINNCSPSAPLSVEEVVVIGGGLMGSSAAWHLSDQRTKCLLIEKQDSIYTEGSSLGKARIARSNNRGNDIWSYMHNYSVAETEDLIKFLNSSAPDAVYHMDDIYTTSPVTYVGRITIYDRLMSSLKRQNIDYEIATTPQEGLELLDVRLPDSVLIQREYNQYSGTINPEALISHLRKGIRAKGNRILFNTKVVSINYEKEKDLYKINLIDEKTNESTALLTRKVVCAAGPYTGKLLSEIAPYFSNLINPQRVFLSFLKIKEKVYESLSEEQKTKLQNFYPVINSSTGTREGSFFSMIEYIDNDGHPVLKIGGHFQRTPITNLDQVWSLPATDNERKWSIESTARYFELLQLPIQETDIEIMDGYSCVYSLTETEFPLVTPIIGKNDQPNYNFVVLGGMSGVGAKGAVAYGLMAGNLINQNVVEDSVYLATSEAFGYKRLLNLVRK